MDKLKSLLSSGSKKDEDTVADTGASGKLTGEGSHFGTGGTGTDSAGYSLGKDTEGHGYSAAEPTGNTDSSGYDIATGREKNLGISSEGNHVNTAASPSALGEDDDATGRAAIGETSTYSSHPLATGDKTSSVIDPTSSDANTFRRPEVSSSTGVGPNAAETAARRAMDPSSEHVPGEFPQEPSNPYASSSIDPRVDSAGHAPVRESHVGRDTALGAGAGAAGLGAYEATKTHEPDPSTAAPSTLTSTTNPTESSPAYGSANESRGLDSAAPATTSPSATASSPAATTVDEPTQKKGVVGTVLGVLGLGGGAAAAKHEHDKDSAVDSTPSTTTGLDSSRNPLQSGPPPEHHRKESIPTTAYPSGNLESVRPSAGPTGQTPTSDSHLGRDAAIGAGGLGAAGLGAHEYEKSREPTTGAGDSTFASGMAGTSSAAPNTSTVHDLVTGSTPQASQGTGNETQHYGRDAAIGGGALGAAGLGAHEYEKSKAPGVSSGVTPTSEQYGNQPIETAQTSQPTTDSSHHYGRDAAIGGGALGAVGLGAHEYDKHEESGISSGATPTSGQYGKQPIEAAQTSKPTTDSSEHYGRDAAIGGGALGGAGLGAHEYEKSAAPGVSSGVTPTSGQYGNHPIEAAQTSQSTGDDSHHYGRDAAIGGGALGAVGLGAHEYEKNKEPAAATTGAATSSQQYGSQPTETRDTTKSFSDQVDPRTDAAGNARSGTGVAAVPVGTSSQPEAEHHFGRDAALVGGGAAATGVAAHEFSEHDAEKAEKEQAKLQKQQTKEMEKEEKAQAKEAKKEQKAEEKAEKKQEKELAKEEKREEKLAAKQEKKEEKIAVKEEKKQEKIAAKEEKQEESAATRDHKRHEEEGAAAVGAGALGAGAYEAEKHHETSTRGGGLAAADAADAEAYNKQNRYTAAMADPGADPTVRQPSALTGGGSLGTAGAGAGAGAVGVGAYEAEKHHGQESIQGTHGGDPYSNRQQVPGSTIGGQQTGSTLPTDTDHHYGRDAAGGTAGAGALGAGAYEAEKHHDRGTTEGTQGSDPYYTRHPVPDSAIAGQDADLATGSGAAGVGGTAHATEGTHGSDPYYNRHSVPDSAIAGQEIGSTSHTDTGHHYGRDAAVGTAGAAAVGGTAYEAEKHHDHSTGHKGGLAAADEDDRRAYGHSHEKEKKPSLFRRIFKRKKNTHTGESEDDEDNYEDVPHDHPSGTVGSPATAAGTTHSHEEGEFSKPSYNPFKKEDPNVKAVEGRI